MWFLLVLLLGLTPGSVICTISTATPKGQSVAKLNRVDSTGLHFEWDPKQFHSSTITEIVLTAVPIKPSLGVSTARTSVLLNATSGSITEGLKPFTDYNTSVEVKDDTEWTTYHTGEARTWPTAPSPSTGIQVKATGPNSAIISWLPPAETNGILKPYKVTCTESLYNMSSYGSTPNNITTTIELKSLKAFRNYTCLVEAATIPVTTQFDNDCKSKSAVSDPFTTWPGTLHKLLIKGGAALDATSLNVTWYNPENIEGHLGGFTVSVRPRSTTTTTFPPWQHGTNVSSETRSQVISHLLPNTEYEVAVRGFVLPDAQGNGGGYSDYSHGHIVLTWSAAPSAPQGVKLHPESSSQMTLSWLAPAESNGAVANYTVFLKSSESGDWENNITTANAQTLSHTFTGLKAYSTYYAAVRASTSANRNGKGGGEGPLSATISATTQETVPGEVRDLTCLQKPAGSSKLSCQWKQPMEANGNIRKYNIKLTDNQKADSVLFEGTSDVPNANIDLRLDYDHTFRLSVSAVTIAEGPPVTLPIELVQEKLPVMIAEQVAADILHVPPSAPPESDQSRERNLFLKLSAITSRDHSPVNMVGVFVEETSRGVASTSVGTPYYNYAHGLSKSWEVFALSNTAGLTEDMQDFVFTLGADRGTIRPVNTYNGPLKPSTTYIVTIRFHNKAGYTETNGFTIKTPATSLIDTHYLTPGLSLEKAIAIVIGCILTVVVIALATVVILRRRMEKDIIDKALMNHIAPITGI